MASGDIVSRLHLLIDRCRHEAEGEVNLRAEAMEKDLLLSLSQVLREIQSWISEAGLDSDSDQGEETAAAASPESKHQLRLERLVAHLVGLLGVKNVHVQHLAGNILVEVSESLVQCGSQWDDFIRLICNSLHLAVVYSFPVPSPTGFEGSNIGTDVLKKANWCTVSGIFRLLRNILKRLSQEENEQLIDVYLESLNYTLAKIPWCRMDTHFSNPHGSGGSNSHETLGSIGNSEQGTVFLGNFVQFLSTLVHQVRFAEGGSDAFGTTHSILQKTIELVPDVLRWCQSKLESQNGSCMSRYLVHKLLVLMIRLTYQSNIKCTILLSWLQYLQHHYQGFLHHTLTRNKALQDNCLEGSPFFVTLSDRDADETHSDHLQRLSVFLFIRCSLTLLYTSRHTDKDCEFDCRKKGMEGMFKWIEQQVPGDTFLDHGTYSTKSVDFSTSFIQLFMHEDDLLFKVLLQLLSVPLAGEELLKGDRGLPQDEEIYVRLSTLFNPVILFCIFLSELHYDHQVLLDYLISKDMGASCAEYLLRCLRTVCDSWTLFVGFPFEENINDSSSKRRRLLETPEVEHNRKLHPQAFENAKDCLLSLQNSVVRLHQKKLFPYNPEALLRRQFVKVSRALSTPRIILSGPKTQRRVLNRSSFKLIGSHVELYLIDDQRTLFSYLHNLNLKGIIGYFGQPSLKLPRANTVSKK